MGMQRRQIWRGSQHLRVDWVTGLDPALDTKGERHQDLGKNTRSGRGQGSVEGQRRDKESGG